MYVPPTDHPLRRLFAGLTEHAFVANLGMGDPPLIDYLSLMLARFIHMDRIHRLKNAHGQRLDQVADMMHEAEEMPEGPTRREIHRHIGDFTLFWTGVFPEAVQRFRSQHLKDNLIDYCEQGKRSYYIASTFEDEPYREEAPVLRRLSDQFELVAYGLNQVRKEWENSRLDAEAHRGKLLG